MSCRGKGEDAGNITPQHRWFARLLSYEYHRRVDVAETQEHGAVRMHSANTPAKTPPTTPATPTTCEHLSERGEEEEEEEEEEAVFISVVNTNEDPPNAHQEEGGVGKEVAFTREEVDAPGLKKAGSNLGWETLLIMQLLKKCDQDLLAVSPVSCVVALGWL